MCRALIWVPCEQDRPVDATIMELLFWWDSGQNSLINTFMG